MKPDGVLLTLRARDIWVGLTCRPGKHRHEAFHSAVHSSSALRSSFLSVSEKRGFIASFALTPGLTAEVGFVLQRVFVPNME